VHPRPMEVSSPVVSILCACRVRRTLSVGSPVLRIRIAHSTRDFGGGSGMRGSDAEEEGDWESGKADEGSGV
jgi:hypothetical protein